MRILLLLLFVNSVLTANSQGAIVFQAKRKPDGFLVSFKNSLPVPKYIPDFYQRGMSDTNGQSILRDEFQQISGDTLIINLSMYIPDSIAKKVIISHGVPNKIVAKYPDILLQPQKRNKQRFRVAFKFRIRRILYIKIIYEEDIYFSNI